MASVDVLEQDPVKCKVTLEGAKYAGKTSCEFVFYDAAKKEIGRQTASLSAGKGECDWTTPQVTGDDLCLRTTYKVFVEKEEYGGFEEEVVIWTRNVKIKALNNADAAALPNARVRFIQEGVDPPTDRRTGDDGTATYPLQKPKDVRIEWLTPFELKSWTKGTQTTGREREAKVERKPYKAAFYSPVWKTDKDVTAGKTHKQYVNLSGAAANEGHLIKLKVGPDIDKDKPTAERAGQKDDVIHIKAEFRATGVADDKNTKRNKPKPCLKVGGAEVTDGSVKQVKLGADGEPVEVELELGYAGGDEVTIKVGVTNACDDAHLKIVTWRRLYYEFMAPKALEADLDAAGTLADGSTGTDLPAGHRQKIVDILKPTFVEFVCHKSHIFANDKAIAGTNIKAAYFGKTGRDLHVLTGKWAETMPTGSAFDNGKGKLQIVARLADLTFSTRSSSKTNSWDVDAATKEQKATDANRYVFEYSPSTGTKKLVDVTGCTWTAKFTNKDDYKLKAKYEPADGDDTSVPAPANAKGRAIKVEAVGLGVSATIQYSKPTIGNVPTSIADGEKVKLDTFVTQALAAAPNNTGEVKVKIHADKGNDRRTQRINNIKTYLDQKFRSASPAKYFHPGLNSDGTPKTGNVDATWFKPGTYEKVKLEIPTGSAPGNFIGAEDATHCKLTVEFKVEQTYEILGLAAWSTRPQVLIFSPTDANGNASTYCHELGHNMGMTIMPGSSKIAPGMDAAKHVDETGGLYYRNPGTGETNGANGLREGHSGSHCATGVADLTAADYGGKGGTCCLFGEGSGYMPFCATCVAHIRARRLTDIKTGWGSRADEEY